MAWLLDRVRRAGSGSSGSATGARARAAPRVATAAAAPASAPAAAAAAPTTTTTSADAAATSSSTSSAPSDAARATLIGSAQEVLGPQPLPSTAVQGKLPPWLRGSLVANGGGDYSGTFHLFDGFASVARVGLNEGVGGADGNGSGSATFAQRMVRTRAYERKRQTGKVAYREFATAPPIEPPGSLAAEAKALLGQVAQLVSGKPEFTDNASVNLIPVRLPGNDSDARMLLAVSETPGASYLLDAKTLETVRSAAPDATGARDGVPGMLTTAHPARLPGSPRGELVNFTRTLPFGGMHLYRMDTRGERALERRPFAFIPDRRAMSPTWVHDFAVAPAQERKGTGDSNGAGGNSNNIEAYVVIVEPPIYMNLGSLMLGGDRGDYGSGKRGPGASDFVFMDWKPEDGVRVTVTPLPSSAAAAAEEGGGNNGGGKSGSGGGGGGEATKATKATKATTKTDPIHFLIPSAFFVFHFGNCFVSQRDPQTGEAIELAVDLAAYDDPAILNDLRLAPLAAGSRPLGDARGGHGPGGRDGQVSRSYYARLTIPLDQVGKDDGKGGKLGTAASPIRLGGGGGGVGGGASSPLKPLTRPGEPHTDFAEFPCVSPLWRGRADSRYAYVMNAVRPTNMGNALAKIDLKTGESKLWYEKGAAPGEPVFVPRPGAGAEDEDDGAVLTFVAAAEGGSFVVVLDAKEWKEVARVQLPAGVPYRFHGGWLPAEE
jgi:carlactone synthase / all-trans-10'-apo-beta-carotenal 13,14-cleaving dioxygenase